MNDILKAKITTNARGDVLLCVENVQSGEIMNVTMLEAEILTPAQKREAHQSFADFDDQLQSLVKSMDDSIQELLD